MNRWLAMMAAAGVAATAAGAGVRVLWTDGVSEALGQRAGESVERNASVRVERAGVSAAVEEGERLKTFGARVAGEDAEGLTVVLASAEGDPLFGALDRERGVATLNVARLAEGDVDGERLERRVARETLRGYAWLAGMETCPFPLCVLAGCGSPEALDAMSMNYCPPCWEKLRGLEAEKGLEVLPIAQP